MDKSNVVKLWKPKRTSVFLFRHFSKVEKNQPSIDSFVDSLLQIAQDCVGPVGKLKMIKVGRGTNTSVLITNTSHIIFKYFLENRISQGNLLEDILKKSFFSHIESNFDGGFCFLQYLTTILTKTRDVKVDRKLFLYTLTHIVSWLPHFFHTTKVVIKPLESLRYVMDIVKSVMSSNVIFHLQKEDSKNRFVLEIAKSFVKSLPPSESLNATFVPNIRFQKVINSDLKKTTCVNGIILPSYMLVNAFILKGLTKKKKKIVIFSVPLEFSSMLQNRDHYNVDIEDDNDEIIEINENSNSNIRLCVLKFQKILSSLKSQKVSIVACQKTIHPFVKHLFHTNGLVIFECISAFHMRHLSTLCGANLLNSFSKDIRPCHIGSVKSITEMPFGNESYFHIEGTKETNVVCVLLCCKNDVEYKEMKEMYQKCINVLCKASFNGGILPGAGCVEMLCANYIRTKMELELSSEKVIFRKFSKKLREKMKGCAEIMAKCMEEYVMSLMPNYYSRREQIDALEMLRKKNVENFAVQKSNIMHNKSIPRRTFYGWNSHTNKPTVVLRVSDDKVESTIIDCLFVKKGALDIALETASLLLRVDGTFDSKD